jgi:hypothetical protein
MLRLQPLPISTCSVFAATGDHEDVFQGILWESIQLRHSTTSVMTIRHVPSPFRKTIWCWPIGWYVIVLWIPWFPPGRSFLGLLCMGCARNKRFSDIVRRPSSVSRGWRTLARTPIWGLQPQPLTIPTIPRYRFRIGTGIKLLNSMQQQQPIGHR